ncbi:MAG: response regulator transcription factor [Acidobacteriota bacterium]
MRILVVEDDRRTRDTLCRGLREQTWAVDHAATGEDAIEKASLHDYDVLVLDLMLPGVGGIEVCRSLRAAGSTAAILMLTARGALDDRVQGLDAGADDYLAKPFAFRELLARLRALGRRHREAATLDLTIGPLVIDRRKRRAWRDGRPLALTSREYALLEHLATNAGRVIGRPELAEHVWDDSLDPWSNTIEVHINRLRRKVDPAGTPRLIGTRRGEGYVLEAPGADR